MRSPVFAYMPNPRFVLTITERGPAAIDASDGVVGAPRSPANPRINAREPAGAGGTRVGVGVGRCGVGVAVGVGVGASAGVDAGAGVGVGVGKAVGARSGWTQAVRSPTPTSPRVSQRNRMAAFYRTAQGRLGTASPPAPAQDAGDRGRRALPDLACLRGTGPGVQAPGLAHGRVPSTQLIAYLECAGTTGPALRPGDKKGSLQEPWPSCRKRPSGPG